jgi:hypothetical protein
VQQFGNVIDEATRRVEMRDGLAPSRAAIRAACRESLRRLGTDYLDLYLLHIWTIPPDEMPGVLDALDELAAEGQIRAYGWSTDLDDAAALFATRPGCAVLQFEANVLNDAPAMHALGAARELGVIVRSPLAMGLLSGKYGRDTRLPTGDIRGNAPEWMKYFTDGRPNPEGSVCWKRCARSSRRAAARWRRAPWPGCGRVAQPPCPSPASRRCARWRRTRRPWPSVRWRRRRWPKSTPCSGGMGSEVGEAGWTLTPAAGRVGSG